MSADAETHALPPARWQSRVRNRLRGLNRRWRKAFPRAVPAWTGPVAGHDRIPATVSMTPDRIDLTVESVQQLRADLAGAGTARSVGIIVTEWRAPWPGWSGRLDLLPGLAGHSVQVPASGTGPATVTVAVAEPLAVQRLVTAATAVLDPTRGTIAASPRGRHQYGPELPHGELTVADGWWQIRTGGRAPRLAVAGRVGDPLDDRQSDALAGLGAVVGPATDDALPVIVQLAMTGVVLHVPGPVPVAAELAAWLGAPLPGADGDPLDWDLRGIAQRRAALRAYADHGSPPVSVVLVTRRPRYLPAAVAGMAAQAYPELEIVVGLHGVDLPPDDRDRLTAATGVPMRVVDIPAAASFGDALTVTTRAARGSLVTKVDDDDRYGPDHVWDLVLARHYSGATVVGKAAEFVHLEPYDTTVRRRSGSELYTDVVAGGTLLLSPGDLAEAGGWPPVHRSVDRALLDRVLGAGGLVYRTHGFGFVYTRHRDGHTWEPGLPYFLLDPLRIWPGLPPYAEFRGGTA